MNSATEDVGGKHQHRQKNSSFGIAPSEDVGGKHQHRHTGKHQHWYTEKHQHRQARKINARIGS